MEKVSLESLKEKAIAAIDLHAPSLREIGYDIWSNPEVAFEERYAHKRLTDYFEGLGFMVERSIGDIETAFRATLVSSTNTSTCSANTNNSSSHTSTSPSEEKEEEEMEKGKEEGGKGEKKEDTQLLADKRDIDGATRSRFRNIGVLCEYDALPEIGHACGHNLIAEAGVAAGLGLGAAVGVWPEGRPQVRVTVLGCPAEEGEGGKIKMLERGCFEGLDCAMMAHPFTEDAVELNALARAYLRITFYPSPSSPPSSSPSTLNSSHSASGYRPVCYEKPENEGTCCSTQDAAVIAYGSLSMLRQQLRPSWLVHGIINSAGGRFASLNPLEPTTHETELLFYFRTPTREELSVLLEKAEACFKAAAVATGCHFRIEQKAKTYENVVTSPLISELFLTNANKCLGLQFAKATNNFSASTDMGNVSHVVPSIHPLYSIGGAAVNHTKAFTAATNTPRAHQATLSVAKAMALTGLDLMWKDTCST